MTRPTELTFAIVDDLLAASARGRLGAPAQGQNFTPRTIGPLIELALAEGHGRALLNSPWIEAIAQHDLRSALSRRTVSWIDGVGLRGLLRVLPRPFSDEYDLARTSFLLAARKAAEQVGFPRPTSQSLVAALREMESNIREHSGAIETGLVAFQASPGSFEFVVADTGVGVLATLREAPEFADLADHGRALFTALQDGASRYGRDAHRGTGFNELFLGIARLNADLRFRTGDHALTIAGSDPSLTGAQLSQKPPYQGFLASIHCLLPVGSPVLH